jgi:radical SAM superfamily enzyme YgiQ (UPF0313 family)
MRRDIVLVALSSRYIHSSLAPWCLLAALGQYGCARQAEALELNVNMPAENLLQEIVRGRPHLVGFSCYLWNIELTLKLAGAIKALLPETVIVLGGPEVSFRAVSLLAEQLTVDYIITGPGERAFYLLCAGRDPARIPGLAYRSAGILYNPEAPLPQCPPSPHTAAYFEALSGRISYVETSRGCPFRCAYCLSGGEGGVSYLPMEQVREDLSRLAGSGTRTVKFVDRTFNSSLARAREIWRFLMALRADGKADGVCFHFEIGADLLREEDLGLLASAPAGLFQIEAGVQTYNETALAACGRKTDLARLEHNLRALIACGNIHVHADLIAGLPGEGIASFRDSLDRAFALRPHALQLGFLKLLHGSRLRDEADCFGYRFTPYPPYEVLQSDAIGYEDLQRLKAAALALDRLYSSGGYLRTLNHLIAASGQPPHAVLEKLGELMSAGQGGLSQDSLCALLLAAYKPEEGVLPAALRDNMVTDILSVSPGGRLPDCLQMKDPRLGVLRRACREAYPKVREQAVGILYHGGERGILIDHDTRDPVTGQGRMITVPLP